MEVGPPAVPMDGGPRCSEWLMQLVARATGEPHSGIEVSTVTDTSMSKQSSAVVDAGALCERES